LTHRITQILRARAGDAPFPLIPAVAILLTAAAASAYAALGTENAPEGPVVLPAVTAIGEHTDTLFIGGYARGSFTEAVGSVAGGLSEGERVMVGRHLDRIFPNLLVADGLGRGGRLRLAYERISRPDGRTRSIRVLAAEAAVRGELHQAFFFEEGEHPGYFDDVGRSLDDRSWAHPLGAMRVTSPFGMRRMHPILRRILPHLGTDYAARLGTPVYATGDGSVAYAAPRGGYGNLVEIQHPNGYATRYGHLARIAPDIAANTPVRRGQVIGYAGMTGLATAPHLHYEVRRLGRPVDPEAVSPYSGPPEQVVRDLAWRNERIALGRLLARAPRIVSARRDG
jgi:murein DD-endopeptidase MepM/ murein hydrolase activator NlpD